MMVIFTVLYALLCVYVCVFIYSHIYVCKYIHAFKLKSQFEAKCKTYITVICCDCKLMCFLIFSMQVKYYFKEN